MIAALLLWTAGVRAQTATGEGPRSTRPSFSVGMGASAVNAQDVVTLIATITRVTVSDFKSAVEFFGAVAYPVDPDWTLKLEYAYLLGTYNVDAGYAPAEFTFRAHLPTLLAQYTLIQESTYAVRAGVGLGYHAGMLSVKYPPLDDEYSGTGMGTKLDLEAMTAFGDDVSAYLGGELRWEFIGDLADAGGNTPPGPPGTSLHFFSAGAKLGFTYYF